MKLLTFRGGVHPPYKKELSRDASIKRIEPPEEVFLPLSQHTGAPSNPIIDKKDEVQVGMKIAEADGKFSLPLHSSVNGVYMGIVNHPHPLGGMKKAMKIKVEVKENVEWKGKERDIDSLSEEEMIKIIKNAGIAGMGGAAFPAFIKMQPPPEKEIRDLIINGAECEPYLTSDHRIMLERTADILKGVDILRRILKPNNVWIGIEANKMDAVKAMQNVVEDYPWAEITVHSTRYPQGSEKQLIQAITGKQVPVGGLPFDVGCYVQNVGTAVAIYEAVKFSKPLYERVVTVTGAVKNPSNFLVPLGTTFGYLIEKAGGREGEAGKIINGGPMMGIAQITDEVPVIKGTTGILVQKESEVIKEEEGPCIRCASCVNVCPVNLSPTEIYRFVELEDYDMVDAMDVDSCIECGSCSYICPASIPLTQQFKYAKAELRKRRKKS